MFELHSRTAIFVDLPHMMNLMKTHHENSKTDWHALRNAFSSAPARFMTVYAQVAAPDQDTPIVRLLDWMEYRGIQTRRFAYGETSPIACAISIDIIDTMISLAADEVVLIGGAGSYLPILQRLQRAQRPVTLVSHKGTANTEASVSSEMRRAASAFVDIADLDITRPREVKAEA
ncbi:NYN domain-containing protein [Celeribacter sp.]|uniref:NYN domain-containing protein n=1 Tax=Celeribacter sp. TaxID=1890673 RepID=UPI003A94DC56